MYIAASVSEKPFNNPSQKGQKPQFGLQTSL